METQERRIRRAKDKEDLLEQLCNGPDAVFPMIAAALAFSACLGFARKKRVSFSQTGEPIREDVFERAGYDPVLDLLALAQTEDVKILADEKMADRILILEEYANGGLEIIGNEVSAGAEPLRCLELLLNEYRPVDEKVPDDEDIQSKLLRLVSEP
jgi:dnd system-associated protein 4